MKRVFKTFLSLFCIFLLSVLCACDVQKKAENNDLLKEIKDKKTFVVGINNHSRPFGYIDEENNELMGFDADLIKEISKKIFGTDKIIKFEEVTPSNRILKLNSKEVDVIISTMTITQERLRVVDFSNPYFMTGQAILVKDNNKIRTAKDLNYKKVGIVLGTTAAANIKFIASHANIVGFKNYEQAFVELSKNNIDAISTDDVILQGIIAQNEGYRLLPDRYSTEFYGIALRKAEESQSLKEEINGALAGLEKTGKLKALEIKYNIDYRRK